jgi:hypothetical protein
MDNIVTALSTGFGWFQLSIPFGIHSCKKMQVINLSLDIFSFVSFVAAVVGTGVPHWDSPTSTHDVNLL